MIAVAVDGVERTAVENTFALDVVHPGKHHKMVDIKATVLSWTHVPLDLFPYLWLHLPEPASPDSCL